MVGSNSEESFCAVVKNPFVFGCSSKVSDAIKNPSVSDEIVKNPFVSDAIVKNPFVFGTYSKESVRVGPRSDRLDRTSVGPGRTNNF